MVKYALKAELAILRSLHTFPYLTVKQITQLLYSPGSIEEVNRKMKAIWEKEPKNPVDRDPKKSYKEYVERAPLYSQSRALEYCYWLSTKGRNVLRKEGYPFTGWSEPAKMGTFLRSSQFPHYQECTDFLIQTTLLPSSNENLEVRGMMHYLNLNRYRKGSVIPDGWLDIHSISSDTERYYCVEVDRDTEEDKLIDKISNILHFVSSGEYQQLYHRDVRQPILPTWLFFTLMGKERGMKILKMIEDVFVSMYASDKANWFRVAWTDGEPFRVTMFCEDRWLIPNPSGKRQVVSICGF